MSATLASDPWNQTVPVLSDGAIETVDGKDPGQCRRSEHNGYLLSRELTPEIAAALGSLSTPLLMRVIKMLKSPNTGSRMSLVEAFQDSVIRSGVRLLVARLTRQILKKVSQACNLSSPKQRLLLDTILRIGLPVFLHEKCDIPMFIEFCSVLGLDPGRPGLQLVHPSSSNGPSHSSLPNSSIAKSSAELERELADEIMLLGTEDLLKTFPIPILQEISQELGLLTSFQGFPPTDTFQLIDLIMDHIFDLVPFQEYTQLLSATAVPEPKPQLSTPEGSKKRKRDDSTTDTPSQPGKAASSSTNSNASHIGSPSPLSSSALENSSSSFATPNAHNGSNKRAKMTENANNDSLHSTSLSPSSAHASSTSPTKKGLAAEASSLKDVDSSPSQKGSSSTEAKRLRGRPPSSSKQQQQHTSSSPSSSSVDASSSSVTGPGAVGGAGKIARASRHAASGSPMEDSGHSTGSRRANAILTDEEEDEEHGTSGISPTKRRRPVASATVSTSSSSASSKKTASSQRGLHSHSKRAGREEEEGGRTSHGEGRGGKYAADEDEGDDESDYEEGEESEEDEPAQRPSGKGRAKYQAPPLSNIKKGVTAQDLHNLYNVTDLQDWCRQHGVDHTGKKSAVIKRILYQLDPTNAKPPPPKKSRRFNSR